jgi:2,3-bisphosphoglycerate-independent phosphoglycerate mutase
VKISKSAHKPLLVLVIDGMGVGIRGNTNPISQAYTPNLNKLWRDGWKTELTAAGPTVGLLENQPSNTDTSFHIFSSGRKHESLEQKVRTAIEEDSLAENPLWKAFWQTSRHHDGTIHLIGNYSGYNEDLLKLVCEQAARNEVMPNRIAIHLVASDALTNSKLDELNRYLRYHRLSPVATIVGEKFAKTSSPILAEIAFAHWTAAKSHKIENFAKFLKRFLSASLIEPASIIIDESLPLRTVGPADQVMFFDVESRDYELVSAKFANYLARGNFLQIGTSGIERKFALFHTYTPETILPQAISNAALSQTRIAEASKFAEISDSFSWGALNLGPGEKSIEIPTGNSDRIEANHNLLFRYLEDELRSGTNVLWANLSLLDSYAHAGDLQAISAAASYLDERIGHLSALLTQLGGTLVVLSDHGNAELMYDDTTGDIHTDHTLNDVPLIIQQPGKTQRHLATGSLIDIAPTILSLLELEVPLEMEGKSLV